MKHLLPKKITNEALCFIGAAVFIACIIVGMVLQIVFATPGKAPINPPLFLFGGFFFGIIGIIFLQKLFPTHE